VTTSGARYHASRAKQWPITVVLARGPPSVLNGTKSGSGTAKTAQSSTVIF
jgi:hypothetical protein